MGEVEAVREDDVRMRAQLLRRQHDAPRQTRWNHRQLEGRLAAEPGPQESPALDRRVFAKAPRLWARVAGRRRARAARSPAPAVERAAQAVASDLRQGKVAPEVRAAIGDDM